MFHEPHQKHSSLFHTDRNRIYTLEIPFCDLIPAPHKALLILKLPMQTFNRAGRWEPWLRWMAETQNSPHAPSIPTQGSPQAHICAQGQHQSSLFSQHSRAATLPMSLGYQQSVPKLMLLIWVHPGWARSLDSSGEAAAMSLQGGWRWHQGFVAARMGHGKSLVLAAEPWNCFS